MSIYASEIRCFCLRKYVPLTRTHEATLSLSWLSVCGALGLETSTWQVFGTFVKLPQIAFLSVGTALRLAIFVDTFSVDPRPKTQQCRCSMSWEPCLPPCEVVDRPFLLDRTIISRPKSPLGAPQKDDGLLLRPVGWCVLTQQKALPPATMRTTFHW
jgi:hypothetical protein